MSDVARATRATLTALSCGASPDRALGVAGAACDDRVLGARYTAAGDDLGNDTFRPDVFGRLPWAPAVVGVLLARAPRAALPRVAEAALAALGSAPFRAARPMVRWLTGQLAGLAVGVAVLLRFAVGTLGLALGDDLDMALALALASLMLVVLVEVITRVRVRALGPAQTLRWLIAGELAQVPPGAVLGPLVDDAHPLGRRSLERMRQEVRGTTTMRDAIVLWVEDGGLDGPSARLVGLVPDGEDPVTATERMARLAALERPLPIDRGLLMLANALVVAAVLLLGHVLVVGLSEAVP
jgi:hypothetical protein